MQKLKNIWIFVCMYTLAFARAAIIRFPGKINRKRASLISKVSIKGGCLAQKLGLSYQIGVRSTRVPSAFRIHPPTSNNEIIVGTNTHNCYTKSYG